MKSAPAHPLNISTNVWNQDLVFKATRKVITQMKDGTYHCFCPFNSTTYEPNGPMESRSQPRFLRKRISDEINIELKKNKEEEGEGGRRRRRRRRELE